MGIDAFALQSCLDAFIARGPAYNRVMEFLSDTSFSR